MNIGIYPGTFDPVHKGHIGFGLAAAHQCGLESVVLLPEGSPRGKQGVSHVARRAALIEEAVRPFEQLNVTLLNDERFTVERTLPALEKLFPETNLTLMLGSDVVNTFLYRWPGLDVLLRRMPLAIGMRAGDDRAAVEAVLAACQAELGVVIGYQLLDSPHPEARSSALRAVGGHNKSMRSLV